MSDYEDDFRLYRFQKDNTFLFGHDKDGKLGKISNLAVIESITANSLALVPSDNGKLKIMSDAAGVAVPLPNNAMKGFAVRVIQGAAGVVTFSAATGSTIHSAGNVLATSAQYAGITAIVTDNVDGVHAIWLLQ